ncbi:universal stress protein [Nocardioides jensenii]|uniref:universal stress protein n=1 Tax=Nocardioides jensenii TaxID=1843 RepID=UPI00082DD1A6|nr:universal stress protein [Nocardioides jensenii]
MDVSSTRQAHARSALEARPLLVGVSPDGRSASAVVWAVQEAEQTGQLVRLVTAVDASEVEPVEQSGHDLSVLARRLALGQVQSQRVVGPVAATLLAATADAELLVIGHRGLGRVARAITRGTSAQVATGSPVPVVVVPEAWIQPRFAAAPIVLGLSPDVGEGQDPEAPALAFAFARADNLQVPLTIVCAWQVPPVLAYDAEAISLYEQATREALETRLEPWLERFPEVRTTLSCGDVTPETALLRAARHAQLTVVGRTRASGLGRHGLGATVRGLLQHTECPVAVVPWLRSGTSPGVG